MIVIGGTWISRREKKKKKELSCSSKKYYRWIFLPKPLLLSDLLFVPLYSTWSPSLHPCLMSELSRGHIYHAAQRSLSLVHTDIHRGWYLLQVTRRHYSPSTRDESTNRSPLEALKVTRWLWGRDWCKTVTSLTPTVTFSCHFKLALNWFHKHWSLGGI